MYKIGCEKTEFKRKKKTIVENTFSFQLKYRFLALDCWILQLKFKIHPQEPSLVSHSLLYLPF